MTETTRPWAGTTPGDAGPYTDAQWRQLYQHVIGWGGLRANVGPLLGSGAQPNEGLRVQAQSPATTAIDILAGGALVQGLGYINTATVSKTIAANASGNPRIDTIVVRVDYALQTGRITVIQGTPAASPSAPSLTQSAGIMWDIPLADIAVANGFVSLAQSAITPRYDWVNAPPAIYLDNVLNNSGATRNTGDVIVWDNTADRAATTTTTRDLKAVAGVWVGRTVAAGYGRVLQRGIGYVYANSAVTRGDLLTTSTTAGQAQRVTSPDGVWNGYIGRALETTSGAGYVLAFVDVHVVQDEDFVLIQDQKTSGTAGQSLTNSTWNKRDLTQKPVDTGSIASLSGASVISLPRGRYSVVGHASSGANIGNHRLRLRDTTNGVTLLSGTNAVNNSNAVISGEFELTGTVNIELQHWCTVAASGGAAATTGESEIYASLFFTRYIETS